MTSEFLSFWTRTVPWANHRVVRGIGVLVFIDIYRPPCIVSIPQSGRHEVDAVAEDIGRIALARGGGYVAGMRSGIWLLGASGEQRRKLADGPGPSATNRGHSANSWSATGRGARERAPLTYRSDCTTRRCD